MVWVYPSLEDGMAFVLAGVAVFLVVTESSLLDYRLLSPAVIALLIVLTLLFAGPPGLPVLVAGTVIGIVPNVTHVRRVHYMGSLMLPLIAFYL